MRERGEAASAFHGSEVIDIDGLAGPVEGDDDGEADGDFSGRDGDNEEDHDLTVEVRKAALTIEAGKCYQGKIRRSQHELEAHEDDDDVPADDDSTEANREEQAGDEEVVMQGGFHGRNFLNAEKGESGLWVAGVTLGEDDAADRGDEQKNSDDLEGEIVFGEEFLADDVDVRQAAISELLMDDGAFRI